MSQSSNKTGLKKPEPALTYIHLRDVSLICPCYIFKSTSITFLKHHSNKSFALAFIMTKVLIQAPNGLQIELNLIIIAFRVSGLPTVPNSSPHLHSLKLYKPLPCHWSWESDSSYLLLWISFNLLSKCLFWPTVVFYYLSLLRKVHFPQETSPKLFFWILPVNLGIPPSLHVYSVTVMFIWIC